MKSASCRYIIPSIRVSIVLIDLCSYPYKKEIFSLVVISLY